MRTPVFILILIAISAALYFAFNLVGNDYLFFAGYTVLQYIVLATAWNILGGYCGYVNFGSAGFFAIGVYTTVFLYAVGQQVDDIMPEFLAAPMHAIFPIPLPFLIVIAGAAAGLIGLGMGYLTLRLRGVFFAIATLALAVVLETFIVNWSFVGGSRGAYVIPPNEVPFFGPYIQFLFALMLILVVVALTTARLIERSWLGIGFATIRDDELAAEASGVPTLRLKLVATVVSGALMGMAGAPVQVRNPEASGVEVLNAPYLSSDLPVAGFALIEAESLEEAIRLVSRTPCAICYGVVEVWPLLPVGED